MTQKFILDTLEVYYSQHAWSLFLLSKYFNNAQIYCLIKSRYEVICI